MSHYKYDRLSAQDSSFLVFETANAPMHVAGTQIFEAGPLRTAEGGIDIARIRTLTRSVLHLIPRYCQKLAWTPFFDRPVWIDDRNFNLDFHIRHTGLPRPGTSLQLKQLISRVIGQRLDRSRPLWETWVVEGLEGDRFALVTKIHHCMIDGQSGIDLASTLLSTNTESDVADESPPYIPRSAPRPSELFRDELLRRVMLPWRTMMAAQSIAQSEGIADAIGVRVRAAADLLSWLFKARSETPLNAALSPHRRFDWLNTSLEETKIVRRALGCTVNDVILAVVTGALREFLLRRHMRPETVDFHVSAPVNARSESDRRKSGNRVSSWIVDLPLDATDPVERIRRIADQTRALRENRSALGVEMMMAAAELAPSMILPLVSRASSLPINMVVTNVPGPQFPLYLLGARMLASFPLVPLLEGSGLGIAILSYDGQLFWGINADYAMVPDLSAFTAGLSASFASLCEAAAKTGAGAARGSDQGSIAILTQPSSRAAKMS